MRPGGKACHFGRSSTEGTYTEIWNLPTGATFRFLGVRTQMVHWRFV